MQRLMSNSHKISDGNKMFDKAGDVDDLSLHGKSEFEKKEDAPIDVGDIDMMVDAWNE